MVASFLLASVAQQSLYQRIVTRPTFNNGYEEYVQAADLAAAARLRELTEAIDGVGARGTRLDRQKSVAAACLRIAALVKQGNAKPVSYPNAMDETTTFPELSHFRTIGSALVHKAYVDFSEGRVNEGFDTILASLTFGEKISFLGPLIFDLVGRVVSLPAWRTIAEHQALVSLPTAWQMQRTAEELSTFGNAWALSIRTELDRFIATIPGKLTDSDAMTLMGIGEELGIEIASLPRERLQAVAKELEFCFNRHYTELLRATERPEAEWIPTVERVSGQAKPQDPVALRVFDALTPNSTRAVMYELVRRTHIRLLLATAAIIEHKWTHGFYPGALSQLRDPAVANDPLTGGEFTYQRVPGSFALYSEGTEHTGRIGLDWTAPAPDTASKR